MSLLAQLPLEVRVDHRERLVEQHGRHIGAHQSTAQRDLLLGVGREACRALVELAAHFQHLGDHAHTLLDLVLGHLAVAQREGQVLGHRHGVVDHRELEHLGNVALLGAGARHVTPVKQHLAVRRYEQARHDVEHGGLATARGAEQRIGTTVLELHLQRQQRVVAVLLRVGLVRMRQVQTDAGHVSALLVQ